ncbi:hypothetical protein EOK75_00990 [Pseudorhodobacter turbinis]|uniref:Uncharacterized protein n=1 Tax=Pseudorhodobacter turbinis TaxID=2500533 RepID=A0A4P8ECL7_9RHOB|nr:hypothetical protein [Pseudorhodobacter turbinis]QCO54522.1 hypothetical protein EOK75_00990 [Pseudorhodobacter turbinis]
MLLEKFKAIRAKSAANRKIPIYRSSVPKTEGKKFYQLSLILSVVVISALAISSVHAENLDVTDKGFTIAQSAPSGQSKRPPREALEACANVNPQSACEFSGRNGEAVQGKCMSPEANVPLACVPANPPKKG